MKPTSSKLCGMRFATANCSDPMSSRYGMTSADFLRDCKTMLPEDQFRADVFAISQITLDVECIIAGFLSTGFPIPLKIDGHGGANIEEDFSDLMGKMLKEAASTSLGRELINTDQFSCAAASRQLLADADVTTAGVERASCNGRRWRKAHPPSGASSGQTDVALSVFR